MLRNIYKYTGYRNLQEFETACTYGHFKTVERLIKEGVNVNVKFNSYLERTPLYIAASNGHEPVVSALLSYGADPNRPYKCGITPLHTAAGNGHGSVVFVLLSHGADPNVYDDWGETPLATAVRNGHELIVSTLLSHGANPNVSNKDGETILHDAARNGHVPIVSALLVKGVDPNTKNERARPGYRRSRFLTEGNRPLHLAASNGHELVVSALLSNGAYPNITDYYGETPLHFAASNGHEPVVTALISNGADPNVPSKYGNTPIHTAAINGHKHVVSALLFHGADPTVPTINGETPLFKAARNGHEPIVSALLSIGVDPNVSNTKRETPLSTAASNGHEPVVSALLSKGADPNVFNRDGETPLYTAACNGHGAIVSALLSKGANPNLPTKKGETPLYTAACNGHGAILSALLSKGANPNLPTKKEETPLYTAACNGHEAIVSALLSNGANPNLPTKKGETSLSTAACYGHKTVVSALLSNGADPNLSNTDGETPLYTAACNGHEAIVSALLSNGANPNVPTKTGETSLSAAASYGHGPVVSTLLSNGADPNVSNTDVSINEKLENDPYRKTSEIKETCEINDRTCKNVYGKDQRETPLYTAACYGHEAIVSALLSDGANPNLPTKKGETPLFTAASYGHGPVVSTLLSNGADPNVSNTDGETPLYTAACNGHEAIVSALLSNGANPNVLTKKGATPLHTAACNGHGSVVSALCSDGADINALNTSGETPLYTAACNGHENIVSALLSNGANPNVPTKTGETPLHKAACNGHGSVVSALCSNGADINALNTSGGTAIYNLSNWLQETQLHSAARCGSKTAVEKFLNEGFVINEKNLKGETPLHLAVHGGFIEIATLLLKNGANWQLTNSKGLTASQESALKWKETELHSAARLGIDSAITMFIQNEDQVNQKNSEPFHSSLLDAILLPWRSVCDLFVKKGYTSLHLAAIYGSRNVTLTLLKKGALLFETDSEGSNAMQLAQKNNNHDVSKLFKSILESGLPKELLYLKTQDSDTFTSNLRSGFYLSFSGKIMSVGHEAVGKTAITTKLRGLKPSPSRQSTEGLDLHIFKAAIDMETKKWVCKELDIEDVAFRDLVSQPKILATTLENITEENLDDDDVDDDDNESTENSETKDFLSDDPADGASSRSNGNIQDTQLPRKEMQKENPILRWIKVKLGIGKASISTVEDIQEEAVRRVKKGLVDSSFAPINMMDFGGQTAFYSTHQIFLTYRGIYILILNGSKGFDEELDTELFIPGLHGKPTSRKFTLFWVGSIESFSTGTSGSFPKILVVCTHKDKVPKNEAEQKVNAIFTEIEKMYEGTNTMKHLVLEHRIFLNALDPEDPEYDRLKDVLVELVCNQPTWGEKLPKAWIYLKLMINRSVEKGETIMSMKALREVNQDNPVQVLSEKDLQLFLKVQHAQGEIIYFSLPGLRENIVISPTFLVDALRSLVTDPTFATGHRNKTVESMNKNGILKQNDISKIWKNNKKVLQHKDYLLPLLEHLDVMAVPRNYNKKGMHVKPDFYYVPSLVRNTDDTVFFQGCDSRVLGLSFKFQSKILPPAIGYRFIASCVDMFEIQNCKGQILLFSGVVVLKVKKDLDMAVFLRPARVDMFLIHVDSRFQIIRDTASNIAECLKDILRSIFENYKETQGQSGMPYSVEYPCFDCLSPCYSDDTDDTVCDGHGYSITKESKMIWKINRMIESCTANCEGLIGADLKERPTDLHLAKLAQQFNWNDMCKLLLKLELKKTEIEAFEVDYGGNHHNVAFLCLRKWRLKTNGTVGDIISAMTDMELDQHAACKMLRNRPMAELNVSIKEPTDQLIDCISNEAIKESLFLSIELGQSASSWLQMKDNKEKIVKINRTILKEWQSAHPKKDQMKDLAQALCNVELNITSFVQD